MLLREGAEGLKNVHAETYTNTYTNIFIMLNMGKWGKAGHWGNKTVIQSMNHVQDMI